MGHSLYLQGTLYFFMTTVIGCAAGSGSGAMEAESREIASISQGQTSAALSASVSAPSAPSVSVSPSGGGQVVSQVAAAQVSNATQLAAALKVAQPGDVINLAGGSYGNLTLAGKSGITLKSDPANPAFFNSILFTSCTGMTLDGLKVSRAPAAGDTDNNVRTINLTSCDGITVMNCDIETQRVVGGAYNGYSQGFSIHVNKTKNVNIRSNNIRGGHRAIMMTYADNVMVESNHIHDFRAVGVGGGGNNHVTIKGNYIHDARPWNWPTSDHGDYIHLWDGKGKPPVVGTVIEDNTIDQGAGVPIMGISVQNTQGVYFVDVRVANNLIRTADNQCIRFDGVRQVDVVNNTLVSPVPAGNIVLNIPGYPTRTYPGGSARFQIKTAQSGRIENNIWGGIASVATFPSTVSVKQNLAITFAQQASVFANPKGTARSDFVALPGGPGAGLGIAP